ncbi:MAG: transglutaminase family protein [Mangrovicoccus sp.]|nr:transglutaminase family protein [Mangrovicoccus sp.]
MKLTVRQSSVYRFDTPQSVVMLSHRLTPAARSAQTVRNWSVQIPDSIRGSSFSDGAGDLTETARINGPVEHVEIVVQGEVETRDKSGVVAGLRERGAPAAYLRDTRLTRPDKTLLDLARTSLADLQDATPLDQGHALMAAVHEAIEPGAERDDEGQLISAAEALAAGQGSALVQAQVFAALAKSQDIPARIVYGYVATGDLGDGRDGLQAGEGAWHGWAELHVGRLGWVGFDPFNACCPDDRYIRLCSGFDAEDAAAIRMVASAQADSDTEISVAVAAAGQVQQ